MKPEHLSAIDEHIAETKALVRLANRALAACDEAITGGHTKLAERSYEIAGDALAEADKRHEATDRLLQRLSSP